VGEPGHRLCSGDEGRVALHEETERQEVHVRDAVLEARGDERRDRRHDREDPVRVVRAL